MDVWGLGLKWFAEYNAQEERTGEGGGGGGRRIIALWSGRNHPPRTISPLQGPSGT